MNTRSNQINHIERIMCATDFSDFGNQTVSCGTALAEKLNARLYLCHIIDISIVNIYGEAFFDPVTQHKRMREYAHRKIEELMAGQTLEWEAVVVLGQPALEISRLAQEYQIDLLIAAGHGRSGLNRLLLGSVAEKLMRLVHRPLLILRTAEPESQTPQRYKGFQRILAGCDFSPDSELAISHAVDLSRIFQAELHVVHVMTTTIYRYSRLESPSESQEAFDQRLEAQYEERMRRLVAQAAPGNVTVHTKLLIGGPDIEISNYARDNRLDLIVLGTRGTGIIETLFVGSTTDRVVRRAECPLLCVCHKT
jgi:nucleotide-binding universal stress UspA family protein